MMIKRYQRSKKSDERRLWMEKRLGIQFRIWRGKDRYGQGAWWHWSRRKYQYIDDCYCIDQCINLGFGKYLSPNSAVEFDMVLWDKEDWFIGITKYEYLLLRWLYENDHISFYDITSDVRKEHIENLYRRGFVKKLFDKRKVEFERYVMLKHSCFILDVFDTNALESFLIKQGAKYSYVGQTRPCKFCGKDYFVTDGGVNNSLFCSSDCAKEDGKKAKLKCMHCGRKIKRKYFDLPSPFLTSWINDREFGFFFCNPITTGRRCDEAYEREQNENEFRYDEAVARAAIKLKIVDRPERGIGYREKIRLISSTIQEHMESEEDERKELRDSRGKTTITSPKPATCPQGSYRGGRPPRQRIDS